MKKLLLLLFISTIGIKGYSQFISGDVGIGQPYIMDDTKTNFVDPSQIVVGTKYTIRLPFYNSEGFAIPTGDLEIVLNLGKTFRAIGSANQNNATLNTLFNFTRRSFVSSQEFVGQQIAPIPPYFQGEFEFSVIAQHPTDPAVPSILKAVINFPNAGSPQFFDIGGANNQSTTPYTTTTTALPVKFTYLNVINNNCAIDVTWNITDQVNVSNYQVEISKDGNNFGKTSQVSASANASSYKTSFTVPESMKSNIIFVRVKQNDLDGKFTYSEVRAVRGVCDDQNRLVISAYPNPVTSGSFINVAAKEGSFKGKFRLELLDNNGKSYQVKEVQVDNVVVIPFEFKTALSPGNYMIRVSNLDGSQAGTVQFVKVGGVL